VQDANRQSWTKTLNKVSGLVMLKLGDAGVEVHPNGEFRVAKVFDIDTIETEMRHYKDEGIGFRLGQDKVITIRLRLERDRGRKCNHCDLFGLGLHVDHICPTPNDYSPGNLQLLCSLCHIKVSHPLPAHSFACFSFCSPYSPSQTRSPSSSWLPAPHSCALLLFRSAAASACPLCRMVGLF